MARAKVLLTAVFLGCLLCACGSKGEQEWTIGGDPERSWRVEETVELLGEVDGRNIYSTSDGIVYLSKETEGDSLRFTLNVFSCESRQVEKTIELNYPQTEENTDAYLLRMFSENIAEDGIVTLWQLRFGEGLDRSYEVVKYDGQGKAIDRVTLNKDLSNITEIAQKDGIYYLLAEQTLTAVSSGGETAESTLNNGNYQFLSLQEEIFLAESTESATKVYALRNGKIGETVCEIPLHGSLLYQDGAGAFWLSDGSLLYRCDTKGKKAEPVLNWLDAEMMGSEVVCAVEMSDETVSVLGYQGHSYVVWTIACSDHPDERTTITLLSTDGGGSIQRKVFAFNASNPDYRVVITYPTQGFSAGASLMDESVQTRMQLTLESQNAPDLVYLDIVDNWESYAEKGVFEDLSPYLERSSLLKESDYLPVLLDCGKVGDKLIFLPEYFFITVIYGQRSCLGNGMTWTPQDFLEICREQEERSPFNCEPERGLEIMLSLCLQEFVDFSEMQCDFDNPLFCELLRDAAKCHYTEWEYDAYYRDVIDTDAIMGIARLMLMEDYLELTGEVPCSLSDQTVELTIKSLPSKDGQPRVTMGLPLDSRFAICSNSANKEGAWQFIEFLQTYEKEKKSPLFSAQKDLLEESVRPGLRQIGKEDRECTEQDRENLLALIQGIEPEDSREEVILRIAREEAAAYFSGQKSAEQVAQVIQNRVELYLGEMQ